MRISKWTVFIPFLCAIFIACLETPKSPNVTIQSLKVSACALQKDTLCNEILQLSPTDSFTLFAQVLPTSLKDELSFAWIKKNKTLKAESFFKTDTSNVPDSLISSDDYGNRKAEVLHFIFDTAPKILSKTIPASGDTLYGNNSTAFRFAYFATDEDNGDILSYTVDIDEVSFSAGTLTEFFQSGFYPGKHRFRVFVQDEYGLKDSTSWVTFFVQEAE